MLALWCHKYDGQMSVTLHSFVAWRVASDWIVTQAWSNSVLTTLYGYLYNVSECIKEVCHAMSVKYHYASAGIVVSDTEKPEA